jgi:hypothetical protein
MQAKLSTALLAIASLLGVGLLNWVTDRALERALGAEPITGLLAFLQSEMAIGIAAGCALFWIFASWGEVKFLLDPRLWGEWQRRRKFRELFNGAIEPSFKALIAVHTDLYSALCAQGQPQKLSVDLLTDAMMRMSAAFQPVRAAMTDKTAASLSTYQQEFAKFYETYARVIELTAETAKTWGYKPRRGDRERDPAANYRDWAAYDKKLSVRLRIIAEQDGYIVLRAGILKQLPKPDRDQSEVLALEPA